MTEKKIHKKSHDSGASRQGGGWFEGLSSMKKDLVCVGFMLIVVYVLFWPVISSDHDLAASGGDYTATHQWLNAIDHIKESEGVKPLWIPYVYGGMPVASTLLFPDDYNWLELPLTGGIGLERSYIRFRVHAGSSRHGAQIGVGA